MVTQRQRIEIHSGLDGELFFDAVQSIGELVIAGKSYGFEWTEAGLRWDREPPYRTIIAEVTAFVELSVPPPYASNSMHPRPPYCPEGT